MDLKQLEDAIKAAGTSPAETQSGTTTETLTQTQAVEVKEEISEDPIKAELEKINKRKEGRTEEEKAEYTFKNIAKRLKDLGRDPAELLGVKAREEEVIDDEDKPLTKKDLESFLSQVNKPKEKTATELAYEKIQDENQRELALYYLDNVIKPSGNSDEDLRNAQAMVNAVRNQKVLEMQALKPEAKILNSARSIEINKTNTNTIELSPEEKMIMDTSRGLITMDDILANRNKRR